MSEGAAPMTADAVARTPQPPQPSPSKRPLIKEMVELVRRTDTGSGNCRFEIKPIQHTLSFDKGFFLCFRAIQTLKAADNDAVIVVGLAGPSGAGKTVFTEKTREFLPGCALLCMDMYNDGNLVVDGNFDDPRLTDYKTLLENIQALKEGRSAQVPIYDFKQSRRVGYRTVETPTNRVVLVEGIYALSDRLRPLLDLRVSIRGGVHLDLVKRVMRDVTRSGQAPEEIIQQISETVYPMYKAFIEPDLQTAHLKVVNTFNPFSGFQSPTYILKSSKLVTEEAVFGVLSDGSERLQEDGITDIYLVPPNEDSESCSASWLRMRSRHGRYQLVFEEYMTDGPFIISPNIKFEVNVRILGGLMALGYTVATIMKRSSLQVRDDLVTVKIDTFEGLDKTFVQVQGRVRAAVEETARRLGLDGTYIPRSYIEQMQLEKAKLHPPEGPAEMIIRTLQSAKSFQKSLAEADQTTDPSDPPPPPPSRPEDPLSSQPSAALSHAPSGSSGGGYGGGSGSGGSGGNGLGNGPQGMGMAGGQGPQVAPGVTIGPPGGMLPAHFQQHIAPQMPQFYIQHPQGMQGGGYPPNPLMPQPLGMGHRNNSFGGSRGGMYPAYTRNSSVTDLASWGQFSGPALETRFVELSSRLDHAVELMASLAHQVQQQVTLNGVAAHQPLQYPHPQGHPQGHPVPAGRPGSQLGFVSMDAWGSGGRPEGLVGGPQFTLGGGGAGGAVAERGPNSRTSSPVPLPTQVASVATAQHAFCARMDAIVESMATEAQSARESFLRDVAAAERPRSPTPAAAAGALASAGLTRQRRSSFTAAHQPGWQPRDETRGRHQQPGWTDGMSNSLVVAALVGVAAGVLIHHLGRRT